MHGISIKAQAYAYGSKCRLFEFLPRDAMRKRGTSRRPVSVRRSVRHTGVLCQSG